MLIRRTPLVVGVLTSSLLLGAGVAQAADQPEQPPARQAAPSVQPHQWPRVVDELGTDRDRVVFTRVPGVVWWMDDQRVDFPEGADVVSRPMPKSLREGWLRWLGASCIHALGVDRFTVVDAPGALTTMDLWPEWWLSSFTATKETRALPALSVGAYPRTLPTTTSTAVSFAPFVGAIGPVRGFVQRRTVVADGTGRRVGPWISLPTWPVLTANESTPLVAARGSTHEFRVRAADRTDRPEASTVTPWTTPTALGFPQDATTATGAVRGDMRPLRQPGAFAGSVLRSRSAGGSWTSGPWYGTELALAFSAGPRGSSAEVSVDGRRLAAVSTYEPRAKQRQLRYLVRGLAPGRAHTVTVTNKPVNAARTLLDLDAYIVTSTR